MTYKRNKKNISHLFLIGTTIWLFSICTTTLTHQGPHHIKPNRYFKLGFVYHSSVGWDASYEISDSLVVKMHKRGHSFKHPFGLLFTSKPALMRQKVILSLKRWSPGIVLLKWITFFVVIFIILIHLALKYTNFAA
jgi:hypothetical protein